MNNFFQSDFFYSSKFVAQITGKVDSLVQNYQKLSEKQKSFFKLFKSDSKKPSCRLVIDIPSWDKLKSNFHAFQTASSIFEKSFTQEIELIARISFHYPIEEFTVDPELPVILEKQGEYGKLALTGIRLTFPDSKEKTSLIIDVQECPHCGEKTIIVHIDSIMVCRYNLDFLKKAIGRSEALVSNFIKKKDKKNARKKNK